VGSGGRTTGRPSTGNAFNSMLNPVLAVLIEEIDRDPHGCESAFRVAYVVSAGDFAQIGRDDYDAEVQG
jgi:hypothetical protein